MERNKSASAPFPAGLRPYAAAPTSRFAPSGEASQADPTGLSRLPPYLDAQFVSGLISRPQPFFNSASVQWSDLSRWHKLHALGAASAAIDGSTGSTTRWECDNSSIPWLCRGIWQ